MCLSNCNKRYPAQNYVEQVVRDTMADQMDSINETIKKVEDLKTTLPDLANLKVIARVFNVHDSQVAGLVIGLSVNNLYLLYEPDTQTTWFRGVAVGSVKSWTIADDTLNLVTSVGSYSLEPATVVTSAGSSLNLDYGTL